MNDELLRRQALASTRLGAEGTTMSKPVPAHPNEPHRPNDERFKRARDVPTCSTGPLGRIGWVGSELLAIWRARRNRPTVTDMETQRRSRR